MRAVPESGRLRATFVNRRKVGSTGWHMRTLEIVWRNPNRVIHQNRWRPSSSRSGCRLYVVEELVSDGDFVYWRVKANLEVLSEGPGAAQEKPISAPRINPSATAVVAPQF